MKRRIAALMLGTALTISSMTTIHAATPAAKSTEQAATDASQKQAEEITLTGEVKAIDQDSITIATGTLKTEEPKTEEKKDEKKDTKKEAAAEKQTEAKADKTESTAQLLELTGKEEKLAVAKDTTFIKEVPQDAAADTSKATAKQKDDTSKKEDSAKKEDKSKTDDKAQKTDTAKTNANPEHANASKAETIKLADIKVGDIVTITCSKDGKSATAITVLANVKNGTATDQNAAAADNTKKEDQKSSEKSKSKKG